jgi:uncharacterized membrane protein
MKYSCSIEINAPIDKVVSLWENEDYFKEWQEGFERIEHLEGTPHTNGAKSKIILNQKVRIELLETIISNDLPKEKIGLYEHIHMTNTQASRFETLSNGNTLYTSEVEYTKFNGFMIKMMAMFFPSKFKEQSQKWMEEFKLFVERTV